MVRESKEQRLQEILSRLPEAQSESLLEFAEFLFERHAVELQPEAPMAPLDIPRPEEETVIIAVRRLTATYPMVDTGQILNETSSLVTQNILHKRDAVEVIDELEQLFDSCYQRLVSAAGGEA